MPTLSRPDAEDLLYREARLLDDRCYTEWTTMLTEDATYWVPCNGDGSDPNRTISLVYDDLAKLRDRISRLESGIAHAQSPRQRSSGWSQTFRSKILRKTSRKCFRPSSCMSFDVGRSACSPAATNIACDLRTGAGKSQPKKPCWSTTMRSSTT